MCQYCIVDAEEESCQCVCSSFMGKKFCKNCGHKLKRVHSPR